MYKIGQKLWYVPEVGQHFYVTITKIGRKWVHTGDGLCRRKFGIDDDLSACDHPYGKCYLSPQHYFAEAELMKRWTALGIAVYHGKPAKGLTVDDIRRAMVILKLMPDIERLPDGTPDVTEVP